MHKWNRQWMCDTQKIKEGTGSTAVDKGGNKKQSCKLDRKQEMKQKAEQQISQGAEDWEQKAK